MSSRASQTVPSRSAEFGSEAPPANCVVTDPSTITENSPNSGTGERKQSATPETAKTKVKAVGCPHDRCKGRRFADHLVLLPEVAASGYGVICRHCRRTPSTDGAWPRTQFPSTYLQSWTSAGQESASLRTGPQTIEARSPVRPSARPPRRRRLSLLM